MQTPYSRWPFAISVLLLVVSSGLVGCVGERDAARPTERLRVGPSDLPSLNVAVPGITTPDTIRASESSVDDDALVIGVRVGDAERAYLVPALGAPDVPIPSHPVTGLPDTRQWDASHLRWHVVNDVLDDTPVTVTYCDRNDCARVLTEEGQNQPLEIGVGGWRDGMLLLIDGQRIEQRSEDVPFEDLPFELTTWKKWRERYPDSDIYVGG